MAKRISQDKKAEFPRRSKRLQSIVIACEIGESMIQFLMHIALHSDHYDYKKISKRFKEMLAFLSDSREGNLPQAIALGIAGKIKDGFLKFTGDHK